MAPAVALGYAFGRIGCQLAGDGDYGKVSTLPWAMAYPHGTVPTPPGVRVQPTPDLRDPRDGFVAWVLWRLATRYNKSGWWTFGWFLSFRGSSASSSSSCAVTRSGSHGLTQPQWGAIASVVVGIVLVLVLGKKPAVRLAE